MKQYKHIDRRIMKLTRPPQAEPIEYVALWGNDPAIEGMNRSEFIMNGGSDTLPIMVSKGRLVLEEPLVLCLQVTKSPFL